MTHTITGAKGTALVPVQPQALTVQRGKLAWGRLKETAHDQRNWWLEVGAALAAGKIKEARPVASYDGRGRPVYQTFSAWVKDGFPGICTKHEVDAAIWFFQEFPQTGEKFGQIPPGLTHPRLIRDWFNAHPAADEVPPWDIEKPAPQPPVLAQRDAERVIKTIQRAESGGEGSDIAAKQVTGLAKKHGMTVEQMTEAAKVSAPDTAFKLPEPLRVALAHLGENLGEVPW